MTASPPRRDPLAAIAPALFVLLWSTGFIGAKFGLPFAPPLTFLATRYALVTALMLAVALLVRARWPQSRREIANIATVGVLVHACYLGGVFVAISKGLPAGIAALVTGLQPLLTAAAAATLLGETVHRRAWFGLGLGLVGVAMVVWDKVSFDSGLAGLPFAFGAVLAITAGTLFQKRHCGGMDLRSGAVIQYIAAFAVTMPTAMAFETVAIEWSGEFIFAMAWLVVVLSVGAISLLAHLIRTGSAAKVASMFYLVPPTTAIIAFFLFGETLSLVALVGMAVTVVGVALATR